MATLLTETKWDVDDDGSPHQTYMSSLYDTQVASPYYKDGRNVPVIGYVNTTVPVTDLVPGGSATVPGPAATVTGSITGVIPTGTSLAYGFSGDNINTFGGSLPQNGPLITAAEWAVQVAGALNAKHGDDITATAVVTDDVTAQIDVVAVPGGNLTITNWTLS